MSCAPGTGNCITCDALNANCVQCDEGYYASGPTCTINAAGCEIQESADVCQKCEDGYYKAMNSCKQCDASCKKCSTVATPPICNQCADGYYIQRTVSDNEFYCSPCDDTNTDQPYCYCNSSIVNKCLTCQGSTGICSTCLPGYLKIGDVCNICDNQQYNKSTTGALECVQCGSQDDILITDQTSCVCGWSNQNQCKTCDVGNIKCGSCFHGYALDPATSECQPCHPSCDGCSAPGQSGHCTMCANGFYISEILGYGKMTCLECSHQKEKCFCNGSTVNNCMTCKDKDTSDLCASCSYTMYHLAGEKCIQCDSSCTGCSIANSQWCIQCADGYYIATMLEYPFVTCSQCGGQDQFCTCSGNLSGNCKTCDVTGTCLDCLDGYYLDPVSLQCKRCDAQCKLCETSPSRCLECSNGYYLSASNVCTQCYSQSEFCVCQNSVSQKCKTCDVLNGCQSCQSNMYLDSAKSCQQCDSSCRGCTGSGSSQCIECNSNYYKKDNQCLPCGSQTVEACVCNNSVLRNCKKCSSEDNSLCQECLVGYALSSTGTCGKCHESCASCSAANSKDDCTECQNNTYTKSEANGKYQCEQCGLQQNQEVCKCGGLVDNNCRTCLANQALCSSCFKGYYLLSGVCQQCDHECAECIGSSSNCTICADNYYISAIDVVTFQITCSEVSDNGVFAFCKGSQSGKCKQCSEKDDELCSECFDGFYLKDKQCNACPAQCLTCNSDGKCLTCKANYYYDSSSLDCVICADQTESFVNSCKCQSQVIDDCSQCEGALCTACKAGTFLNVAGTKCGACDISCDGCTRSESPSHCTQCSNGYYNSSGRCIKCQSQSEFCTCGGTTEGQCKLCADATSEQCLACAGSLVMDPVMLTCGACHQSCSACFQPLLDTACISCADGTYERSRAPEGLECKPCGFQEAGYCYCARSVAGSCRTCAGGRCASCFDGFALAEDGSCKRCDAACDQCSLPADAQKCLSCQNGYYVEAARGPGEVACALCGPQSNVPCFCGATMAGNCRQCDEQGHCKSCVSNYYLAAQGACQKCDPSCNGCYGEKQCVSCSDGYYEDASGTGRCVLCADQLQPCTCNFSSLGNCRTCAPLGCASCVQGYQLRDNSCEKANSCAPECLGCAAYDDSSKCYTCANATYVQLASGDMKTCHACPESAEAVNQYLNFTSCICSGSANCLNCNPAGTLCGECLPGYLKDGALCAKCDNGYRKVQVNSAETCQKCLANYIEGQTQCTCGGSQHCQYCATNDVECATCMPGYELEDGACQSCSTGYYLNGEQCERCTLEADKCVCDVIDKCLTCDPLATCIKCQQGYTLENNKCILEQGAKKQSNTWRYVGIAFIVLFVLLVLFVIIFISLQRKNQIRNEVRSNRQELEQVYQGYADLQQSQQSIQETMDPIQ